MERARERERQRGRDERTDEVTEAGIESFPASDPPAFTSSTASDAYEKETQDSRVAERGGQARAEGGDARHRQAAEEREQRVAAERRAAEQAPAPDPVKQKAGTGRLIANTLIVVLVIAALVWLIFG